MANMIEISHLDKSFGEVRAVNDLSFTVGEGELFAFLGVNGAGKSTTINIICGQLLKDGGTVVIGGRDIDSGMEAIKSDIGVVFQSSALDSSLSVYDNLLSRASLYGIVGSLFKERLEWVSSLLDLGSLMKRPVGKLSGGQRRRIDIARALLNKPRLLILDEPTTGLDPQTRRLLWNVIGRLRVEDGITVLLTTHYMEEAADADSVVIIDGGRIVASGTPLELKSAYAGDFVTLYGVSEEDVSALGVEYSAVKDGFRFSVSSTAEATELILKNPSLFRDYEITKGKMDDVFLAVTGKKLEGGETK